MPKIAQNSPAMSTCIIDALPFDTYGNLSGDTVDGARQVFSGILPRGHRQTLDAYGKSVDYVVYSYATPIAWRVAVDGEPILWVMPDVKYSVTTSKAQGRVRYALSHAHVLEV